MKNFPIVGLNNYKSVDICFQNLLDPTLHKVLFENLEALTTLKITYTNINYIESFTFKKLLLLREIFLNNNRLGKISAYAFYGLRIEHLYLDDNPKLLIDIRGFVGLNLRGLSLSRCHLIQIQYDTFAPLFENLNMLTLTDNHIESVDYRFERSFSQFTRLKLLSFGKNPLRCDCENLWLIRLLRFRYVNQKQNPLIPRYEDMYPNCSEFRNISMLYVNESHLKCRTPKISSITLKVINCHTQVNCQFIRPIAWSVHGLLGKRK